MWIVFDLIILVIIVLSVFNARRKGFIKASYALVSLILTFVLMFSFKEPFKDFLEGTFIGESINSMIENSVNESVGDEIPKYDVLVKEMGLPSFLTGFTKEFSDNIAETKEEIVTNVTVSVTDGILNILSVLLLFLIVRISLYIIIEVFDLIAKLPVLKSINKFAGALMGLVNGLFIVYLVCAVMILFVTNTPELKEIIDNSTITKYFYENNLLMMILK